MEPSACGGGSCGGTSHHGTADLQARIADHPCYSEQAHHRFARMHLAVAPACNIQCNYCNRKYDCSNESRPGVVSELLSPEQAAHKALAVAAAIPQLSVIGIAGPGDALANPQRTFAAFAAIAEKAPDLKLCLSTNGLALPDHVDDIVRLNVDHVTVTINCLDPEVGARIYPWIFFEHKRRFGRDAARLLIERQWLGLEMLAARGVLVKVNSVMIPGINDAHLKEVSQEVKAKGAFLHNVMPLISAPEHGTYFGLSGQRAPSAEELQALQDACAGDMTMMRHCRQCRADAIGMLGEDRNAEFTLARLGADEIDHAAAAERRAAFRAQVAAEKAAPAPAPAAVPASAAVVVIHRAPPKTPPLRVAVASKGGALVDEHFGHAREFLIYDATATGARFVERRASERYCVGSEHCDDDEDVMARILRSLADCEVMLCGRVGIAPWRQLEAAGIQPDVDHAMEAIEESVMDVWRRRQAAGKSAAPAPVQRRCG